MKKLLAFLIFAINIYACSIFDAHDSKGHTLVGRNFDWDSKSAYVWAKKGGDSFGYFFITSQNDERSPYEGVNEKGLFIAISAVPDSKTAFSFKRPKKSLELIKEVLQNASNIEEAIEIMDNFMPIFGIFMGKPMVHFKIVQKDGKSVLVEYFDKKTNIIKNAKIMTNHYVGKPSLGSDSKSSFTRYNLLFKSLKDDETISIEQGFNLLSKVSQDYTLWSNVYDLNTLVLYMKYRGKIIKIDIKKLIEQNAELKSFDVNSLR